MNIFKSFLQTLRRYKMASTLNIIGLSVAFASFMIIVTQVKYDLSFDRYYKNKDRIFRVENQAITDDGNYSTTMSRPVAEKLFSTSPEIEKGGLIQSWDQMSVYDLEQGTLSLKGPYKKYVAEPGALEVFEFEYLYGSPERFSEPNTVLISEEMNMALYGGRNPVGFSMIAGNNKEQPLEIIGVYKDFPRNATIKSNSFVQFIGDVNLDQEGNWNYPYYIRLNSPKSAEDVQKRMNAWFKEYAGPEHSIPDNFFRLTPIPDIHFSQDVRNDQTEKSNRTTVYSLLTIAVLIIVIAMINFVNFSTSLVPVRIRGINTRKVMGESNASLRRNMIGEAVGMAVVSFAGSLLITEAFASSPLAGLISTGTKIGSDMLILGGTGLVAVVTGLLAGIYPAFYSTSFQPALVLKGSFGLTPKGRRLRTALVGFQYVISIALIIMAASVYIQNRYIRKFDTGFQRENILTTWISTKLAEQKDAFVSRLKSNPDIRDVTFASGPLVAEGRMRWGVDYKGNNIKYDAYPVAPNFLSFMGIQITEGRDFTESDHLKINFTHIFNQTAQRQDSIAVGDKVTFGNTDIDIVGIARDFNFKPLQFSIEPFAFLLFGKAAWHQLSYTFIKVNDTNVPATIEFIESTIKELDPDYIVNISFMDDQIGSLYTKEQNLSQLITLFSLLSVLISVVGVFGLILFETQYRRKEIGVRKVFGATIREIILMFNQGFIRIVLVCFVVAAPIAYCTVKHWQESFAYQSPIPAWVFAAALVAILLITIVTITLQSYKTATENPVKAIRTE